MDGQTVGQDSVGSVSKWIVACSASGSVQLWLVLWPTLVPQKNTRSARRASSSDSVVPSGLSTPAANVSVSATAPLPDRLVTTTAASLPASTRSASGAPESSTPPPATINGRLAPLSNAAAAATLL